MGYLLSQSKRTAARVALSDLFNDFPVDYDAIVQEVKDIEPDILYEILYSEVAPVCFTNIAAAVPSVWTGFEPESLNAMIEQRLIARKNSWIRRQADKALVAWLKFNYAYFWEEISRRL
ncbi:DUF7079 family protein [Ectopseudomonas guguanensis]|uniref:DUF7079 domain-containing protein n=1 Tax=Ectopseudomonas guguanensis TaxID=1198456 RepID=A0A1H0VX27_9GAMM|nr:hypothetical protein [Pseudomonas guguanensis]SDP83072.1 hypothetical protein SAMN05216213_106105 [Pseudomonas guguanensis]